VSHEDHVAAARAVYDASRETYLQFVGTEVSAATEGPIDRSLLTAFVELVGTRPGTHVADVGCGPGRVAAFLAAHGLDVVGVDVSPAMLGAARDAHPGIQFEEGRLDELPITEGSLAGVVCWYSIIYTPPERLDDVFAELRRVLTSEGYLLIAFQVGSGEPIHRADAHGTKLSLTSYRHALDDITRRLEAAGLSVHATALREPELDHESSPQAFVIARSR
jgi:SAM-dependent methyltransferase